MTALPLAPLDLATAAGQEVLHGVAIAMLTYPAAWWLNEGYAVGGTRHSAHAPDVGRLLAPALVEEPA